MFSFPYRRGIAFNTFFIGVGSGFSYWLYRKIIDDADRNSLLVQQTMFNLKNMERYGDRFRDAEIISKISGKMLQRKGIADINFIVSTFSGEGGGSIRGGEKVKISVKAKRKGWDWNTELIETENI